MTSAQEQYQDSRGVALALLKLTLAIVVIVAVVWVLEGGRPGDGSTDPAAVSLGRGASGITPRIGEAPPAFTLGTSTGASVSLADLRGRPVVVNFWATWCPPCRGEMPDLANLARDYRDAGLVVVGVNLEEDRPAVQRYADTLGLGFTLALDTDGAIAARYNLNALPTTYFVDRDGLVRDLNIGALTERGLRTKVAKVL